MNLHYTRAGQVAAQATARPASTITDDIVYSIGISALGYVVVAHSLVGICAILI